MIVRVGAARGAKYVMQGSNFADNGEDADGER